MSVPSPLSSTTVSILASFKADKRELQVPTQWSKEDLRMHLAEVFGLASSVKLLGLPPSLQRLSDVVSKEARVLRVTLVGSTHVDIESMKQTEMSTSISSIDHSPEQELQQELADPIHQEIAKLNVKELESHCSSFYLMYSQNTQSFVNQAARALGSGDIALLARILDSAVGDQHLAQWLTSSWATGLACRIGSCAALRLLANKYNAQLSIAAFEWGVVDEHVEFVDDAEGGFHDDLATEMPIMSPVHVRKTPLVCAIVLGALDVVRYMIDECKQETTETYARRTLRTWLLPASIAALRPEVTEFLLAKCAEWRDQDGMVLSGRDLTRCASLAAMQGDAYTFNLLLAFDKPHSRNKHGISRLTVIPALDFALKHQRLPFLRLVLSKLSQSPITYLWFKPLFLGCCTHVWYEGLKCIQSLLPGGLFPWQPHSDLASTSSISLTPAEMDNAIASILYVLLDSSRSQETSDCLSFLLGTGLRPSLEWCENLRECCTLSRSERLAFPDFLRFQVLAWQREQEEECAHAFVTLFNRGYSVPLPPGCFPLVEGACQLSPSEYPDPPLPVVLMELVTEYMCGTKGNQLLLLHERHQTWFGPTWKKELDDHHATLIAREREVAQTAWTRYLQRIDPLQVALTNDLDEKRDLFINHHMATQTTLPMFLSFLNKIYLGQQDENQPMTTEADQE